MKKNMLRLTTAITSAVMICGTAATAFGGQYTVVKGDWLSKIAPKFDTTWQNLAEINKIANPNLIFPGQVLEVPDMAAPAPVVETPAPVVQSAALTGLTAKDITLTGNAIAPAFDPSVKSYTMNVQSDVYGVKVTPVADADTKVTVTAAITPGAYGKTDTAAPLTIEKKAEDGSYLVPLTQTYEGYDSEFVQTVTIATEKGTATDSYTLTITRACDKAAYALFKTDTYKDEATGVTMPYALYVPSNYDSKKTYPIVFALHGSGQRNQPLDMVLKRYQMATVWAKDSEAGHNQCIVLAPQCASADDNDNWTTLQANRAGKAANPWDNTKYAQAAYTLLQKTMSEYSVDKKKVYMTGLSAGGYATFSLAIEHPDVFAALVPDAGAADPSKVAALKGIPMWILQAEDDPTVKIADNYNPTTEALKAAGVEYKTTLYKAGDVFYPSAHFSWVPGYADKNVRDWVFAQSK